MSLDTTKIKQVPLDEKNYIKEDSKKSQIVLHHTAGGPSAVNVVNGWAKDKRGPIGTCVAISADGEIVQAFSSKYWAYHLGVKQEVFRSRGLAWRNLDKISIGIEICNWGGLTLENGKFMTYVDTVVPENQVVEYKDGFKGYKYYHKYTDQQIEATRDLLIYWADMYDISLAYDYNRLFTVNNDALTGVNGVYTHNSYRKDKVDIHPFPAMIDMLKSL